MISRDLFLLCWSLLYGGLLLVYSSCMENMASVIRRNNNKILKPTPATPDKNCNRKKPDTCPLAGACLTDNLIYKAEVEADNIDPKVYIGPTTWPDGTQFQIALQWPHLNIQAPENLPTPLPCQNISGTRKTQEPTTRFYYDNQ